MSKFLLIGSVAAMLYGDCVFAMDDIDPWRSASSSESQDRQDSESTSFNSPRQSRSNSQVSLKNEDPNPIRDAKFERVAKDQNRFIKIGFENFMYGSVKPNRYQQYHYDLSDNALVGQATPTTIETITRDDLRCWNDIAEIRYANDVSYDKLENPKVILYRNKDNSCYIILRIEVNKDGVFYGTNERSIEVGKSSFAVYDVSEDVGSFTDSVARLIYVDESGLYFVPKAKNSVENVIDTYQKEGKFKFEGSVIKISAVDGTITLNGEPITKENFFDNWILEERETEKQISQAGGRTVIEKVKESKQVLSTKQPNAKEIIRNFYPPKGYYEGMYSRIRGGNKQQLNTFTEMQQKDDRGYQTNLTSKGWMDYFIRAHISIEKSKSKEGCEEVVRNGMFLSFLSKIPYCFQYSNSKFVSAINRQIRAKGISDTVIPVNRVCFSALLRDPEFVKSLKPAFAEIEKDYKHNKESEMWIPFEIVRNL